LLCAQEEQEELAAVEAEARQELRAAQQALAEAQEALAVTSDKVNNKHLNPACRRGWGWTSACKCVLGS